MSWHQFEVTKQSHKAHQKWSFWLVSGQMTQKMHHVIHENVWLAVHIVLCVHGEFVIATKIRQHQFEHSKRATESPEKVDILPDFCANDPSNGPCDP